jgi:hypothetical protein
MLGIAGHEALGRTFDLTQAFDLSFRQPPLKERSGNPLLIGLGDPVAGPLLGLFYDAPSTPEQLAGPPDLAPAHSHSCDNFRICMKGELWVGRERYHHGEFRLQQSGRPYGSDGDAPHAEGNWRIIFFADRRGFAVRPTNPELRKQYAAATREASRGRLGDVVPELLDDEDPGVVGMATNLTTPLSRLGHIDGTFADTAGWGDLGDGSKVAGSLMGLPDLGPVVLLISTPAGKVASPAYTFGTDSFRLVIDGSYAVGGESRVMGDMRIHPAGVPWPEVVAGPEGLGHVLILGDRRGATAEVDGSAAASRWAAQLGDLVAGMHAGLGAAAA